MKASFGFSLYLSLLVVLILSVIFYPFFALAAERGERNFDELRGVRHESVGAAVVAGSDASSEIENLGSFVRALVDERVRSAVDRTSRFREGEIVVKYRGHDKPSLITRAGADVVSLLSEYSSRADVEYAEPNYIATAFYVPNDQYYQYQWNFDNAQNGGVEAEQGWDVSNGSGVAVAVIDTGVAYENYQQGSWFWRTNYYQAPDLAGTNFVAGYDFVNDDTHPNDDEGHGTHVAGTIAGTTGNGTGVAGLAYGASVMPIKVLDSNGSGSYLDVAEGIRWAADHGAKVINLSLGGSSGATYLEEALAYAYNKGVTIVAAAGNNGSGSVSYPAAYDNYVIAVGATRFDETKANYSNYGSSLDIVAPGGDTSVDQNGDGYGDGILQQTFSGAYNNFNYYFYQGTSMATPHVAAAAAMVIAAGKAGTPAEVQNLLQSTADDLGASGRDNTYGHGLLNLEAALKANVVPPEPEPTPEPDPEPEPEPDPEPEPPASEVMVFSDSFESGLGQWTQDSQRDWFQSGQRSTDGSRSAEVDGRASNASLMTGAIDLSGKSNARISFDWFIENSLDSGEYIAFDVSTNGGGSWSERARLRGNVDQENVWHSATFELNGISSLQLRFRGTMSASNEDANVDNVSVVAF